ncbi:MFS transporter [Leptothoe spongobia]|uniref:MFS transporter n=1 Tax=Leptothoe spongobia TAU-MAC 1115 TaxID=1967444 RepID=A0A947DIF2_9CYAN|nr:MFS transporter [Leptothoe spongobia]MBT9317537.1 MFS transporter [Leptothoe spongobia TAU-MAC 1115]
MNVFVTLEPSLRRSLVAMFVAGLCFWAGLAGLLPALPLYIEQFGANGQQIGLVMASFAIGLLTMRPVMARITDERGRKPVLLIGLLAIAVAPLLYWLVSFLPEVTWQITMGSHLWRINSAISLMMVFRAFHGLSIASFVTAYSALVADLAPAGQRGELIGYMSLVNPIGMAVGPALGGYLQAGAGFTQVFVLMAMLGAVGLVFAVTIVEPHREKAISRRKTAFWSLLLLPAVRVPALMLLLVGLAFGGLATFVPLYARESSLSLNIGLIYTASAISSFVIRLLAGKASDRYGRGPFITLGLMFYSVSMLALWLAYSEVAVLFAAALQGMGGGMLIPMVAALMADRSRPTERGLMFGLCLTGFDVGIALAGPVMGQVADLTSYRDIFGVACLMTILGLVIFITTSSKDINHSIQFSLRGGKDVYAVPNSTL